MGAKPTRLTDWNGRKERRVEHHLEEALTHSDDPEVCYHLREALHLMRS